MIRYLRNLLVLSALTLATGTAFAQTSPAGGCVVAGPADAPLTIEEYGDFECPYCVRGAETIEQALKDYPGKLKVVFRHIPLSFHSNSLVAAKAMSAICVQSPSLAGEFQRLLFTHQNRLKEAGEPFLYELASRLGVDIQRLKTDMNGPVVAKILADDLAAAASRGFKGTPSFVIGSESITGARPYAELKEIIERQLMK